MLKDLKKMPFGFLQVRQIPISTVLNMSAYLVLYEMERPFTPPSPRPFPAPSTVTWSSASSGEQGDARIEALGSTVSALAGAPDSENLR